MTSVLGYARTYFIGGNYSPEPLETFDAEVERFHSEFLLALTRQTSQKAKSPTQVSRLNENGKAASLRVHDGEGS